MAKKKQKTAPSFVRRNPTTNELWQGLSGGRVEGVDDGPQNPLERERLKRLISGKAPAEERLSQQNNGNRERS